MIWKEKNKRVFEREKDSFDKVKDKWFKTQGFLIKGHSLISFEDLDDLIDILVDM